MTKIASMLQRAKEEIESADDVVALEAIRVEFLGKKGHLTQELKNLAKVDSDIRPKLGQELNLAKREIASAITAAKQSLVQVAMDSELLASNIDVTLPARGQEYGSLHPVSNTLNDILDFFTGQGFQIAEGPEIEEDFYNFSALNIPDHHPARMMHDTFYFPNGKLLRTHTSPAQIRHLLNSPPPTRLVAYGKVYRCDSDLTHTPMFHQVECFVVGEKVSFANLKNMLEKFLATLFGSKLKLRFRPSYFPFTEPSAEVDIQCFKCGGSGCRLCSDTGWIEILGCGMIHPNVLNNCAIDSKKYSGYAFGVGIDRVCMLKYGIDDLRLLFENDLRFLQQF